MSGIELAGTWHLAEVTARHADGSTTEPYGAHPKGVLVYGDDGSVAIVIVHEDLQPFAADHIAAASPAEASGAFRRSLAYFGRYDVDPTAGTVIHHIEGCTFPNWIGSDEVRSLEMDDGRLVMTTPPLPSSHGESVYRLVWAR